MHPEIGTFGPAKPDGMVVSEVPTEITLPSDVSLGFEWKCTTPSGGVFYGQTYYLAWRAAQFQDNRMGLAENMKFPSLEAMKRGEKT